MKITTTEAEPRPWWPKGRREFEFTPEDWDRPLVTLILKSFGSMSFDWTILARSDLAALEAMHAAFGAAIEKAKELAQ